MIDVVVTDTEWAVLMDYKRDAPYVLMKARSEAILLLADSVPVEVIARFVDRAESTVTEWARQWNRGRLSSIYTGHAGNINASKLTAEQRREVTGVLSCPASDAGRPAQFWTVPELAAWLQARFEVVYESDTSYHFEPPQV